MQRVKLTKYVYRTAWRTCKPVRFQVGDVVEVEISLQGWKKQDLYVLTAVLRGITFVEGKFAEVRAGMGMNGEETDLAGRKHPNWEKKPM
jgi:uncharacterized Fe-S cluster-containing radical SAM superfamily enzyme